MASPELKLINGLKKLLVNGGRDGLDNGIEEKLERLIVELECPFNPVQRIKDGFRYFLQNIYDSSVGGQQPKFLVFACSDCPVSTSNVLNFQPGEAFVFHNIANMVPPFNQLRYSGVGAAIEYAVAHLHVDNILIIGHSRCSGIRTLMNLPPDGSTSNDFIDDWVKIGLPAKSKVLAEHPEHNFDEQCKICEKESVNFSLINIQTYPYVKAAIENGSLELRGGYYDFVNGSFELWEVVKDCITPPILI